MQRKIWLSFDLGVRGDYEGMYAWLDEHQAIECGDNVAHVVYQFSGELIESLKADLSAEVEIDNKKTRIYVIWQDPDTRSTKGRFIFGKRKASSWTGYAASSSADDSSDSSDES